MSDGESTPEKIEMDTHPFVGPREGPPTKLDELKRIESVADELAQRRKDLSPEQQALMKTKTIEALQKVAADMRKLADLEQAARGKMVKGISVTVGDIYIKPGANVRAEQAKIMEEARDNLSEADIDHYEDVLSRTCLEINDCDWLERAQTQAAEALAKGLKRPQE